jgi:hypothetical protein
MKKLSEQEKKIITDIQLSIPKEWLDKVTKQEDVSPTVREVYRLASEDMELSEGLRNKAKLVLDSGVLDQKVEVQDPIVSELIDAYVSKEIVKASIAKKIKRPRRSPRWETVSKRFNLAKQNYDKAYKD